MCVKPLYTGYGLCDSAMVCDTEMYVRLVVPAQTGTVGKWQTLETGNMGATQRSRVDQERFALTQGRYDGMRVSRQGSRASS